MWLFNKKTKTCKNCKHFKSDFEMYNHTQGFCKQATVTSAPFKADFISSKDSEPIKVWWNFGCIRFEKRA